MSIEELDEAQITRDDNDYDIEDDIQDWKALNKLTKNSEVIPKRGEKDFEPDGTSVQSSLLDDSRNAMYQALSYPRGHHLKQRLISVWISKEKRALVPHAKGGFFKDIGKAANFGKKIQGLWLEPLETVYLVERGSMAIYLGNEEFELFLNDPNEMHFDYDAKLVSLSLGHIYTLAFDGDSKLMDSYIVYAYLKRHGYLIQSFRRLDDEDQYSRYKQMQIHTTFQSLILRSATSVLRYISSHPLFTILHGQLQKLGIFAFSSFHDLHFRTKHYFNYTSVFLTLKLIPSYSSLDSLKTVPEKTNYSIDFNVWKPTPNFSKKNPAKPDFHICVVNTDKTTFPELKDIQGLFNQINYKFPSEDTPEMVIKSTKKPKKPQAPTKREIKLQRQKERQLKLDPKIQARNAYFKLRDNKLKYGASGRCIILALVQSGVVNFMNVGEGDFALENFGTEDLNEIIPSRHHGIIWNEKY
ncbi:uncharacterized protein AC631_01072 [Debaryomyces fabryi]|uniref:tRNA-splicing endonuclease subunit Sen54 N-terminal domain-containing protein n=1 Tax=Debaryomyces fabryi TaxID=58627 RepID=A0A0V1Q3Y9_9ASCO|nr:uncharacterized protein AC631_01072 [Debaryomyces fabryi]KSA03175.1 hypothetical protein AC631_01072 [Debaryomyces fabryi]CUM48453.1 unnamed protein product [Debaryomyces fabryi]